MSLKMFSGLSVGLVGMFAAGLVSAAETVPSFDSFNNWNVAAFEESSATVKPSPVFPVETIPVFTPFNVVGLTVLNNQPTSVVPTANVALAPEVDPTSAMSALTLLFGVLLVMQGRRPMKADMRLI